MINPASKLADVAESQTGASEDPIGSNRGVALVKYFAADNYRPAKDEGYPWCAAFVSWCVQEFLRTAGDPFSRIIPPREAAAFAFRDWGKTQGAFIFTPAQCAPSLSWPQRGDIVVFKFSHIGIVAASHQGGGRNFTSVEGNSNNNGSREGYAVVKHPRTFSEVREFIRLTPRAERIS